MPAKDEHDLGAGTDSDTELPITETDRSVTDTEPSAQNAFVGAFVKAAGATLHLKEGAFFNQNPIPSVLRRTHSGKRTVFIRANGMGHARVRAYVIDRKGRRVAPRWDEITARIEELCTNTEYGPPLEDIDAPMITQQVIKRFRNGMSTRDIDALIVQLCSALGDS